MNDEFDPEELYDETDRETIARWLEAVEENIDVGPARGGTAYSLKEKEFVASVRSRFDAEEDDDHPLSGKQLVWLRCLYERS